MPVHIAPTLGTKARPDIIIPPAQCTVWRMYVTRVKASESESSA